MNQQRNFGLSRQDRIKEEYDHWDWGIFSKKGRDTRIEQKKEETAYLKAQREAMEKIANEPTQTQTSGISKNTVLIVSVILVVGLVVGFGLTRKRRKGNQAVVQEQPQMTAQIV